MPSETTQTKADRLLARGAVQPIDDQPRAFTVQGDTSTHRVVIGRHMAWCDCPSGRMRSACSHIEAARKFMEQA